jgi:hypothetical protein
MNIYPLIFSMKDEHGQEPDKAFRPDVGAIWQNRVFRIKTEQGNP